MEKVKYLDLLSRQTVQTITEKHAGVGGQKSGPTVKTEYKQLLRCMLV